jgi:hypothetical protein
MSRTRWRRRPRTFRRSPNRKSRRTAPWPRRRWPGQQRLAGAGRADHQHAARNLAAELLELARIAQELDQLADFFLGLVATGDVGEGDLHLVLALQLGARAAEAHRTAAAAAGLQLAHEEDEDADDQDVGQDVEQDVGQRRPLGGGACSMATSCWIRSLTRSLSPGL